MGFFGDQTALGRSEEDVSRREGLFDEQHLENEGVFPGLSGSERILAQPVRESENGPIPVTIPDLPWGHQITLFERAKEPEERAWYGQYELRPFSSRAPVRPGRGWPGG